VKKKGDKMASGFGILTNIICCYISCILCNLTTFELDKYIEDIKIAKVARIMTNDIYHDPITDYVISPIGEN
jgi:hypothetical protein